MAEEDIELEIAIAEEEAKARQKGSSSGGFWASAWENFHPIDATVNAAEGLWNFGKDVTANQEQYGNNPFMLPLSVGKTLYKGVDSVQGAMERTQDLAAGAIPGGTYLKNRFNEAIGYQLPTTSTEQGAELGNELSLLPGQALLSGGIYGASKIRRSSSARSAGMADALADPASEAAIRYAENRGLLNTPSAKKALDADKVTQEISDAASVAQKEANYLKQPQGDYLPGNALGYPESSASTRPFAATEEMAQAGQTLIDSGVYQGGDRINPFTGKFEGAPSSPMNSVYLADKLETASADIIQARRATVEALDQAMNDINSTAVNASDKISPITFDANVSPLLGDLKSLIDKRTLLTQSQPMGEAMAQAYMKVKMSFDKIYQGTSHLGFEGAKNGVRTSEALSLIENMNAFRRSLGEFDESARAAGLNSTHLDFAGRAAELKSLGDIQTALQSALEVKASEILGKSALVSEPKLWQPFLSQVSDQTLGNMNRSYGAFQTAQEAARTYGNTTLRGMVSPEPGRLITSAQQTNNALPLTKTSMIQAGWDKLKGKPPPNPALNEAQRVMGRPNAAISQVVDGLLLREKPVPIISRDWEKIRLSPDSLKELKIRAAMMGIVAPQMFDTLSDVMKKEVHKMVVQANPQGAESVPGNYNIMNGQFLDPLEKDAVMQDALDKPVEERANIIGNAFQNKYVGPMAMPQAPTPQYPIDLDMVLNSFNNTYEPMDNSQDMNDMVSQLERATRVHAQDF